MTSKHGQRESNAAPTDNKRIKLAEPDFIGQLDKFKKQSKERNDKSFINIPLYFQFTKDFILMIDKIRDVFGKQITQLRDPHNSSLLHVAASQSDVTILQRLISDGINARESNVFGFTPLHIAMLSGNLPVARYLIDLSPTLLGKPSLGWQLYEGVPFPGRPDQLWDCFKPSEERKRMPQALYEHLNNFTPTEGKINKRFKKGLEKYHAIAFANDFPQLPTVSSSDEHDLLKKHLQSKNARGDTPLICAVRGGAIDVVEELLEINIDVCQTGFANATPLITACMFDDAGITEILVQSTPEDLISAKDAYGFDAYLVSAKCSSSSVFAVLRHETASPTWSCSLNGDSFLYWVLRNKMMDHEEIVTCLRGANGSENILKLAVVCADIYRDDEIKAVLCDLEKQI